MQQRMRRELLTNSDTLREVFDNPTGAIFNEQSRKYAYFTYDKTIVFIS